MKTLFNFIKTTLVGGFFLILPIAFTVMLLDKALHVVTKFVGPLAKSLPIQSFAGIEIPFLLAILLLLAGAFLSGLVAKTTLGTRLKTWLENVFLQLIPGYTLMKGLAETTSGIDSHANFSTALLGGGGRWELCFIVERHPNGYLTVFKPGAPSPTKGGVIFVSPDQVREIDVTVAEAMKCLMQDGGGSAELLLGKLKA